MGEDKGLASRRSARLRSDEDALATRREDARARAARARDEAVCSSVCHGIHIGLYVSSIRIEIPRMVG